MLFFALVFWLFLFPDGHRPPAALALPFGFAVAHVRVATVFAALDPVLDYDDAYELSNPLGIDGLGDVEAGVSGGRAPPRLRRLRRWPPRRRSSSASAVRADWSGSRSSGSRSPACCSLRRFLVIAPAVEAIAGDESQLAVLAARSRSSRRPSASRSSGTGSSTSTCVIRRTLVYGALTVLLGAAYAGLVLAGQAVFSSFAGGGDLAIAGSTLVSRRSSCRCAPVCSGSSTAASTGAATTRSARSTRSGRGCATRSSSTACAPTSRASCARRCSRRTSRCGCGRGRRGERLPDGVSSCRR